MTFANLQANQNARNFGLCRIQQCALVRFIVFFLVESDQH